MPLKAPKYSISEAQKRSTSGLLRDAEESGLVLLERHGSLAGVVLTGTLIGLGNLRRVLRDDPSLASNPVLVELARILTTVLDEEAK